MTPNPWFWLLAFVTSYGPLGFTAYAGQGVALVPPMVGNGLAVVSFIVLVYALLSLGRNIGFIPALRKIVTRGAYRFVRHPIYTGTFVSFLAFVLRGFSVLNLTVAITLLPANCHGPAKGNRKVREGIGGNQKELDVRRMRGRSSAG